MRFITSTILGLVAVQQAAACDTCQNWGSGAQGLPSCQSACNQCTQQQAAGLDFSSPQLQQGPLTSYGDLDFSGCNVGHWPTGGKRAFIPRGLPWKRWNNDKDSNGGSDTSGVRPAKLPFDRAFR